MSVSFTLNPGSWLHAGNNWGEDRVNETWESKIAIERLDSEPITKILLETIQNTIEQMPTVVQQDKMTQLFLDKLKKFKEEAACKIINAHVDAAIEKNTKNNCLVNQGLQYHIFRLRRNPFVAFPFVPPFAVSSVNAAALAANTFQSANATTDRNSAPMPAVSGASTIITCNNPKQQGSQAAISTKPVAVLALTKGLKFQLLGSKVVVQEVDEKSVSWQEDLAKMKKDGVSFNKLFTFIEDLPPGLQEEGLNVLYPAFQKEISSLFKIFKNPFSGKHLHQLSRKEIMEIREIISRHLRYLKTRCRESMSNVL